MIKVDKGMVDIKGNKIEILSELTVEIEELLKNGFQESDILMCTILAKEGGSELKNELKDIFDEILSDNFKRCIQQLVAVSALMKKSRKIEDRK